MIGIEHGWKFNQKKMLHMTSSPNQSRTASGLFISGRRSKVIRVSLLVYSTLNSCRSFSSHSFFHPSIMIGSSAELFRNELSQRLCADADFSLPNANILVGVIIDAMEYNVGVFCINMRFGS
jgi:hypothetical protein